MLYQPIYGAYTELFAGLSPDVTEEKTGAWSKSDLVTYRKLALIISGNSPPMGSIWAFTQRPDGRTEDGG